MPPKIHVIGIGDDGLAAMPTSVRELITGAQVLLGTERTLSLAPESKAERHVDPERPQQAGRHCCESAGNKRVVMLVHGDPLFYGLARYVSERLGKDRFVVVPHVSSMQLAFARVMETWEEAYLTNLANHPLDAVLEKIRTAQKVGLFTSDQAGRPRWRRRCLARKIDYFTAYVCENLGARDERVTRGTLAEIAAQEFDTLNVMILVRDPNAPDRPREAVGRRLFGNPDDAFLQSKPQAGPVDAGGSAGDGAGAARHRPVEHRVGRRRRQRLGEHRSGPNGLRRQRLRDRNGRRRAQSHPRKRRTLRRGECECGARPRAGSL